MGSRILIVGANGFLGKTLAHRLIRAGHSLSGTRLPGTLNPDIPSLTLYDQSVDRSPALASLLSSHDVIINCAGQMRGDRASEFIAANVHVPETLVWHLQQFSKPPVMFHFSSVAAIGPSEAGKKLSEESPCKPVSLYGRTKRAGELALLEAIAKQPRLPLYVLRPPSLFGPGDPCFFDLFVWARRGIFPKLCTRNKVFNLVYIHDLTQLFCSLLDMVLSSKTVPTGILHIGFPVSVTDNDLCRWLSESAGKPLKTAFVGNGASQLLARLECLAGRLRGQSALFSPSKVAEMSYPNWLQSFSRLESLGLNVTATPFQEAFHETASWYVSQGWLQ